MSDLTVNLHLASQYTYTSNNVPFGGYKTSGWGRELGSCESRPDSCGPIDLPLIRVHCNFSDGLEEYLSIKAVHWNYGERVEFPLKL